MQRYRRNTITYRGVKVRYSHLFIVLDGIEYTTTEIDEKNLESIMRAYAKKGYLVSNYEYPSVQRSFKNVFIQQEQGYYEILKELVKDCNVYWYPKNIIELEINKDFQE